MKSYVEAKEIRLVYSGVDFFNVLQQMIESSEREIHLQTYIFDCDSTGMKVIDALIAAAARGVRVFLMVDAYGSSIPRSVAAMLRSAGVSFRLFSPLFASESLYIGRRLHHKVVVCDGTSGLIGGINIADKYNQVGETIAWLDYAVLCRGEVCGYLQLLCAQFYRKQKLNLLRRWERAHAAPMRTEGEKLIRFRRNDWLEKMNEIHASYVSGVRSAKRDVIIVGSYFLPGRRFRRLLRKASERGVQVMIIMAGTSDSRLLRMAESYLYDFYLRHKVQVFEWGNSVLHGKAMVIDDQWATIGSYNLNFLSHYISIELNADIIDPPFIRTFATHLREITATCCTNVQLRGNRKGILWKISRWAAYAIVRMISGVALSGRHFRKHRSRGYAGIRVVD